jgi:hypothetical protein
MLTSPNVSEPFQIAAILASSHELAHARRMREGQIKCRPLGMRIAPFGQHAEADIGERVL